MENKGPYREGVDLEAEELKKMEEKIGAEGKFSIRLPEKIKIGAGVLYFGDAIKKNINPKDIIFYSLATGILKYTDHGPDQWTKKISYRYNSLDNPSIGLTVELPPKKYYPAIISDLSTKADIEKEKVRSKENRKKVLVDYMDSVEKKIKETNILIKNDGKFTYGYAFGYALDEENKEVYFKKLKDLKPSLERLLFTINDKLEEANKK